MLFTSSSHLFKSHSFNPTSLAKSSSHNMDDSQFGLYIRKLNQTTPEFNLIMTKMQFLCALAAAVVAGIQLNRTNDVKSSSLLIEL
jgi:hypothetical protein